MVFGTRNLEYLVLGPSGSFADSEVDVVDSPARASGNKNFGRASVGFKLGLLPRALGGSKK